MKFGLKKIFSGKQNFLHFPYFTCAIKVITTMQHYQNEPIRFPIQTEFITPFNDFFLEI
jgi:hypothetical protein